MTWLLEFSVRLCSPNSRSHAYVIYSADSVTYRTKLTIPRKDVNEILFVHDFDAISSDFLFSNERAMNAAPRFMHDFPEIIQTYTEQQYLSWHNQCTSSLRTRWSEMWNWHRTGCQVVKWSHTIHTQAARSTRKHIHTHYIHRCQPNTFSFECLL